MAERTHIIYQQRGTGKEYLRDVDQTRMPITTTDREQALVLSMAGAVAIARDLDQKGGWRWFAEPKNTK